LAALPLPLAHPARELRDLLGKEAWERLPVAVRRRFNAHAVAVDYVGSFEIVRASLTGRIVAQICRMLGTPVVPHTGRDVPATVHVVPHTHGVQWLRVYHWPHGNSIVRSTKVIDAQGAMTEQLPAGLRMALDVFERDGVLHFVSRGYFFELSVPFLPAPLRLPLPAVLSPGTTHVEHIDESQGWFRFTMRVRHALLGEMYYQTGRFHAAGDQS
jgi:hypothetical protein